MDFDSAAFADSIDHFVGLAFDVDVRHIAIEKRRNVGSDGTAVVSELGAFAYDGDIDVADGVAGSAHAPHCFGDEYR